MKASLASDGYRRLMRWAALPVTDRRWAAPLAAVALGFGLFVGVALGPGTASTVATGVSQIIEEVPPAADDGAEESEPSEAGTGDEPSESGAGFGEESGSLESESGFEESSFGFAETEAEAEPETEPPPQASTEPEEEEQEGEEEGQTVPAAGTVVHVNPAAGSYTLVEAGGALAAVHAPKLPKAGTQLSVLVRTLANGTFAEAGARKKTGSKARASFNGIVTYVDPDPASPAYSVSKRGVSVLVNVRPDPAGAVPVLPAVGAYAVVAVEIEALPALPTTGAAATPAAEPALPPGAVPPPAPPAPLCDGAPVAPPAPPQPVARLWQAELDAEGVPFTYSDFAGIVTAVCPQEGRLYISADDLRAGGSDLAFAVPKGIRTDRLKPGDSVTATAEIATDGTLKLTGLAGDERTKGADDARATQGDLVDHNEE
jgi:hypothetical protein